VTVSSRVEDRLRGGPVHRRPGRPHPATLLAATAPAGRVQGSFMAFGCESTAIVPEATVGDLSTVL
jgi:hypothetical protein